MTTINIAKKRNLALALRFLFFSDVPRISK